MAQLDQTGCEKGLVALYIKENKLLWKEGSKLQIKEMSRQKVYQYMIEHTQKQVLKGLIR